MCFEDMCLEKFFLKMLMPHSGHSTMSGLPAITSQVTSQNPSQFVSSAQAMGTSVVLLEIDQSESLEENLLLNIVCFDEEDGFENSF